MRTSWRETVDRAEYAFYLFWRVEITMKYKGGNFSKVFLP